MTCRLSMNAWARNLPVLKVTKQTQSSLQVLLIHRPYCFTDKQTLWQNPLTASAMPNVCRNSVLPWKPSSIHGFVMSIWSLASPARCASGAPLTVTSSPIWHVWKTSAGALENNQSNNIQQPSDVAESKNHIQQKSQRPPQRVDVVFPAALGCAQNPCCTNRKHRRSQK